MGEIKRWTETTSASKGSSVLNQMQPTEWGMWVLHSDHLAAMREKDAELDRAEAQRDALVSSLNELAQRWQHHADTGFQNAWGVCAGRLRHLINQAEQEKGA